MDIFAGLTAATQAIEIAKVMRNVDKSYSAVELKAQVVDLMDRLIDVKGALQDAREAIDERDKRIEQLVKNAQLRVETVPVGPFRYEILPGSQNEPRGLPFCPRCDEVDGRVVRTIIMNYGDHPICPQCKTKYARAAEYSWEPPKPAPGRET